MLFALLFVNVAGIYAYFGFQLAAIHRAMRAELLLTPSENLQNITMSLSAFRLASEGDDEIKWQSDMYDVARIEIEGDMVRVFALRDDLETELLDLFDAVVIGCKGLKSPPNSLIQYLALIFTLPAPSISDSDIGFVKENHFTAYQLWETSAFLRIVAPPPRG